MAVPAVSRPTNEHHDHGLGPYLVIHEPADHGADGSHDVSEDREEDDLLELKTEGACRDDTAEGEDRGQPVPEDGAREQEVDGVRAGSVHRPDPPDQQSVGR